MDEPIRHVARKNVIAYIRSAIGTTIWLGVWAIASLIAGFNNLGWLALAGVGMCVLVVLKGVYNFIYLRTIRWEISEEGVRVRWGVMPWARNDFLHPYETIFEAYYTFGFLAKLFGYGHTVIRRTDGLTTAEEFSFMHDPGAATRRINGRVKELRQTQRGTQILTGSKSEVEQLAELARLKDSGSISAEEYAQMKARILGTPPEMPPAGRSAIADSPHVH